MNANTLKRSLTARREPPASKTQRVSKKSMLDHIRSLFKRIGSAADEQSQREAMVDLLVWTMYADNILTLPENDRIDQVTEEMSWSSPMPPQQYVNVAIAKVRDAIDDPEEGEAFLNDISDRLGSAKMRMHAYEACRDLAKADGEVVDKEMHFLSTVRTHFDIREG